MDETLYPHGSAAVTLVDGLVLARAGFHGSINCRSVVIYGRGRKVTPAAGGNISVSAPRHALS